MTADDMNDAEYFGTRRLRTREGRCYEIAARALVLNDTCPEGTVLVHGILLQDTYAHAWLELPGGTVWEPREHAFWPPEEWAEICTRVSVRYTRAEAIAVMLETHTYGPWQKDRP